MNDKLFYTVLEDYADISTKAGKIKKMKVDPHYNVLQVSMLMPLLVIRHKADNGSRCFWI